MFTQQLFFAQRTHQGINLGEKGWKAETVYPLEATQYPDALRQILGIPQPLTDDLEVGDRIQTLLQEHIGSVVIEVRQSIVDVRDGDSFTLEGESEEGIFVAVSPQRFVKTDSFEERLPYHEVECGEGVVRSDASLLGASLLPLLAVFPAEDMLI